VFNLQRLTLVLNGFCGFAEIDTNIALPKNHNQKYACRYFIFRQNSSFYLSRL
jgi:hypothetical protein